jgi:hypothetical protein
MEYTFRDEQCRAAAHKMSLQKLSDQIGLNTLSGNTSSMWKAYYAQDPRRKCILLCKLEDRSNFAVLSPMVLDGTKCGFNSHDICVNGHCLVCF